MTGRRLKDSSSCCQCCFSVGQRLAMWDLDPEPQDTSMNLRNQNYPAIAKVCSDPRDDRSEPLIIQVGFTQSII